MQAKRDKDEKLYIYVDKRDLEMVNKLLIEGANPAKCTSYRRSAVGQAAFKNYPEILSVLLSHCKNEKAYFGESPQQNQKSDFDVELTPDGMEDLQWDNEIKDDPNYLAAKDEWSRLYMYYAKMFEQTGQMLATTLKLNDPHVLDDYNQAPIHYAAVLGHTECLTILLESGSPVDLSTQSGVTPLHLAVNNIEIVKILLQKKADPNRIIYDTQETVLHIAAKMGNAEVVECLLEHGAKINTRNSKGKTPLMTAICRRNNDTAICLINKDACIKSRDNVGSSAMYYATVLNNVSLAAHLLRKGAEITEGLLELAVKNNCFEMTRFFIEHDATDTARFAQLALYYAIDHCNNDMTVYLLNTVSANILDRTVFHLGDTFEKNESSNECLKLLRTLLDYNFEIDDNDWDGILSRAAIHGPFEIFELLFRDGAEHLIRDLESIIFLVKEIEFGEAIEKFRMGSLPLEKLPKFKDIETDFDIFLKNHKRNPISLQSLCRIRIRKLLVKNIYSDLATTSNHNESKLRSLINQLNIPKCLTNYLFDGIQ